jgi:hypothetical protein
MVVMAILLLTTLYHLILFHISLVLIFPRDLQVPQGLKKLQAQQG